MAVSKCVIVTGASGLLGRAVRKEFIDAGWTCVGTAFSRATGDLVKVDIREKAEVEDLISKHKPDVVVHAAAERRPDKVQNSPDEAERLNVIATQNIVNECSKRNIFLIYISTDYVFDGRSPPHKPDTPTNPLNAYGKLKLKGEEVVLQYRNSGVLRVPILYGNIEYVGESAVTTLLSGIRKHPEPVKMCNYQHRFPTFCPDVALVLRQIAEKHSTDPVFTGTWHWSGEECYTKYEMALTIAEVLSLPSNHLIPLTEPPSDGALRPKDSQLDATVLKQLGFGRQSPFKATIKGVLLPFAS